MRPIPYSLRFLTLSFSLSLLACGLAWGQTPAASAAAHASSQPVPATVKTAPERRYQHIEIEDAGSKIDEIRLGGETKSITVQPKGGMPTYQVAPASGERSWKVLGF